MPYAPGIGMPMHPGAGLLDPMGIGMTGPPGLASMGMGMMGYPALSSMGMGMGMGGIGMGDFHPGMLGGMRSRHSPYYHQTHGYGYGRSGARYLDPYDLFDDIFEGDSYLDDYDDIVDPLLAWMRMARGGGGGGGGGRRGRRGRYGRYRGYGGGGLGYSSLLD